MPCQYTAELKRPVSEPLASKKAAVEAVMDALALLPCRDTKIGNASIKGISGGQAKRVNIGAHEPAVLAVGVTD